MALIRIMSGSETYAQGSSKLFVQVAGRDGYTFVSDAAKKPNSGIVLDGRPAYVPAARSGMREQGGWFDGNYNVADDTVLRLTGQRTERVGGRTGFKRGPFRGHMFIRTRAKAALRRIALITVTADQSALVHVLIEGRFDVLSVKEAGRLGAPLERADLAHSKVEAVREVFTHTVLQGEREGRTRQIVKNVDGKTVRSDHVPRAIDLGD